MPEVSQQRQLHLRKLLTTQASAAVCAHNNILVAVFLDMKLLYCFVVTCGRTIQRRRNSVYSFHLAA